MEENRRFSFSDLFIKIILVLIFVLFTIWLLSLSNKGLSNSLNVLTDNIFSENIEKMKEVGKEYFTIERLPEKVGDINTLTLQKMYDEKLILELKDKYGNACSANDSYISIEKYDNEYQMKVYLECGDEKDHIIVIMGCYDYCENDICEVKPEEEKQIEYEYKKTTGGYWTDYGKWSEWSKVSVSKTDYRQVETKKVNEEYTYDKVITDTVYKEFELTCPNGYKITSDKTKCYKTYTDYEYVDPVCPNVDGYTLNKRDGFTCSYSKVITKNAEPLCPSKSGWTYIGRDGLTCNYKRTVQSSSYDLSYVTTKTGSYVPADTNTYDYVQIDADYVYDCNNGCAFRWIYTYKVYKKNYGTTTEKTTDKAYCANGSISGNSCVVKTTDTIKKDASCKVGVNNGEGKCKNSVTKYSYTDFNKTCPSGYSKTNDGNKCYSLVNSTVTVTGNKEVTYYRYRVREYKNGSVSYKWSFSREDKKLLDAGYKLTGRTR